MANAFNHQAMDAVRAFASGFNDENLGKESAADPVRPGHIRLAKLANEGRLACGDTIEHHTLGLCTITTIESTHTLTVRAADGQHYRLTGLFFPGARLSSKSPA
jgi:hypothetical protein